MFAVADATALPYPDASFDVVILANALHIMDQPEHALAEVHRVLKIDGLFIATDVVATDVIFKASGHHWHEEDFLKYLWQQSWQVTFCKPISASLTIVYAECKTRL